MVHKTVMKVDISDDRWKKRIFKAVSGIPGVDIIEADAAKGTLTVTGAADPYEVILRTKKTGKCVEVVSIGPAPAAPKPAEQKKPEEKKPPPPEKKPPEKKPEEKKPEQKPQAQPQLQLQLPPPPPPPQLQLMPQPQPQLQLQPQPQPTPYFPSPYMGQNFHPTYMGHNYPMCEKVAVVYVGRQDEPNPPCSIM